ncbi:ABC transporter substrate-binding protein [Phytohabitans sp. ZYX-F-186]|uniref:ABC transporter substrate-binding protein n=1 Tax=Phytohabitans maris TaxID=3071409 RepID=A0ABU0ZUU2_9ACTN|nr:ABC transporter substrate-binding protein [Phytohabitans sp. ZYX-F-186]MDQ7910813.1 ABC transporter substrate-binding protein [Phytohabitans sp. ZYX-F-186]
MRRWFHAGVAGLLLAAGPLAACGGESDAASGDGGDITIGIAAALTGPLANDSIQKSIEYAIKQVNDKGGVLGGRKLKAEVVDIGATAATAQAAARKFTQADVPFVVGYSITQQNLAASPVFLKAKTISMIGTASTANNLDKTKNPYTFSFNIPDDETAEHQVQYALQDLRAEKVALLLDSTAFGKGYGDLVTPLLQQGGAQIVETQYINATDNDVSAQVTKILAGKPDVLMVALLNAQTGKLMYSEIAKQTSTPPKVIGAAALTGAFGSTIPWDMAQGTYVTIMTESVWDPTVRTPEQKAWYEAVTGAVKPADNTAEMHDAVLAVASAIDSTKSTDPDDVSDYLKALKGFTGFNGIKTLVGSYECDAQHQCLHQQYVGQVDGEQIKVVKKFE